MSVYPPAVLAKPAILQAIENKEIFVSKFDDRQVNNCSYDIRLGDTYYEEQPSQGFSLLDPYDPEYVEQMWGEPKKAVVPGAGYPVKKGTSKGVIAIPPGGFILAHSEEFIGCVDTVHTTMIKARSTTGRSGIQICACAGWGDIGFATRWTLEIKNNSKYRTIVLRPGQRIGQIVFMPTTGIEEADLYGKRGKYQKEDIGDLFGMTHEELVEQWDPSMMLPRAWEDWDVAEVLS